MLDLHWETTNTWYKKLQRILPTIMLATLLFFKRLGSWKIEGRYSQHYMFAFTLFWIVNATDGYSEINDK